MVENTIDETPILSPRLTKARRLLDEGAVTEMPNGTWRVEGDTHPHTLAIAECIDEDGEKRETLACSCKAGSFGNGCSHRDSVELALSRKRRAA